jgi:hypothetical protein
VQWLPDSPALPVAVAIASVGLLVWGRRGRRVNDHPLCRRCSFDLVGLPDGGTRCSECGADLSRRRALRHGVRQPRRRAVVAALLMLIPAVACLAFHAWSAATEVPFVRREPVWWLISDTTSQDAATRDDAFDELLGRLRAGDLSAAQVKSAAAHALVVQGDVRKTWLPRWGDFVEEAYRGGKLPADSWRTYVRQAPQLRLVATEHFRRRHPAWLELVEDASRVGSKQDLVLRVYRRLTITDARGNRFSHDFGSVSYTVGGSSRLSGGWSLPLNDGVIGRLVDGRQEARLEVVVEVCDPRDALHGPVHRSPAVATTQWEMTAAWTVEPSNADAGSALTLK